MFIVRAVCPSVCLSACMCGATENARHENAGPNCRGGKCGKSLYGKPKCEKVSQSSCVCVQSYSFSISLQTYATRGVPYYRVFFAFSCLAFSASPYVSVSVCASVIYCSTTHSHTLLCMLPAYASAELYISRKCIYILALEMASAGNRHCVDTLSWLAWRSG